MIILILILGFLIRLVNLNQSLWLDEAIEILAVKNNSYIELIKTYSIGDFHPPLYHFVLKFWDSFFGYSEIASRIPSVVFGVLTIFFVYKIGQQLAGKKVAILSAIFLALNPLAIYYSQEARMYSLAALAVTASVYFFLKKKYPAYFICFIIALYSNYLPILMIPVFLFWSKHNKKLLFAHGLLFISALPWMPFFFDQLATGMSVAKDAPGWEKVVGGFDSKALPLTFVKFIVGRISIGNKILYAIVMTPVLLIYGLILSGSKEKFLWSWLIIPLILGFLLSFFIPVYSYFRFLFVLPAFVILLAMGAIKNNYLTSIIIGVSVISLLIFNQSPVFHREDWREAVKQINLDPGIVLLPSLAQVSPLNYYNPKLTVQDASTMSLRSSTPVYYFRYVAEIFDPENQIPGLLMANGYLQIEEKRFPGLVLIKYGL